jgi:hypothetical protein
MHTSIRYYAGAEELVDAVLPHEGEITKLLREITGFRAYYLLRSDAGDAISVSVYDDRAGAEASNDLAKQWIAANLPDLRVGAPRVMAGEVAISA